MVPSLKLTVRSEDRPFQNESCLSSIIFKLLLLMEEILHALTGILPLFTGFYTSQVVQVFFHQECVSFMEGSLSRVISRIAYVYFSHPTY